MWPVSSAYKDALTDGVRTVKFKAELYNKNFDPVGTPLHLESGGSVEHELRGEPQGRASFALIDEQRVLPPQDDARWFSWNVKISVGLKVSGEFEWVPVFFGPVQDVSQSDIRYEIDCDTKDVQHLAPHSFSKATQVRKHTKVHRAIREVMEARGETRFDLANVPQRLPENRAGKIGVEPWKFCRSLARDADKHLFYRGDGRLKLQKWPDHVVWRFTAGPDGTLVDYPQERSSVGPVRDTIIVRGRRTERVPVTKTAEMDQKSIIGATSVHVENKPAFLDLLDAGQKIKIGGQGSNDPETRKIAGSYTPGSRTIPLSNALDRAHNVGAPVSVEVKKDVERAVIGKATLTQNHKFSSQSMTGGHRPRIEVFDRPSIHKVKRATEVAESIRDRVAGQYEQSIAISSVPIWHLEVGDIFVVDFRGVDHRSRIQRVSFPLELGATMELNWLGERRPRGRKR